jgi:hypothetical protein
MTEGKASSPSRFCRTANQFGFTFNWAYVSRKGTAYFSSACLPKRARGLDRRLPTLGTGGDRNHKRTRNALVDGTEPPLSNVPPSSYGLVPTDGLAPTGSNTRAGLTPWCGS